MLAGRLRYLDAQSAPCFNFSCPGENLPSCDQCYRRMDESLASKNIKNKSDGNVDDADSLDELSVVFTLVHETGNV